MDLSERIDKLLNDTANEDYWLLTLEDPDNQYPVLQRAAAYGLIIINEHTYELTQKGHEALRAGGFEKWLKLIEHQNKPNQNIHVGGPVIGSQIGHGSSLRDLNSQSPAINAAPQQAQPRENPIKKSDHSIWDKIKYVSVIVGGVSALIVGLAKVFGWW
ncbi:hypothetical protein [Spirosoma knui]